MISTLLWTLLIKFLQVLVSKEIKAILPIVTKLVNEVDAEDISNAEKRKVVIERTLNELKESQIQVAGSILNLCVELAVAKLRSL